MGSSWVFCQYTPCHRQASLIKLKIITTILQVLLQSPLLFLNSLVPAVIMVVVLVPLRMLGYKHSLFDRVNQHLAHVSFSFFFHLQSLLRLVLPYIFCSLEFWECSVVKIVHYLSLCMDGRLHCFNFHFIFTLVLFFCIFFLNSFYSLKPSLIYPETVNLLSFLFINLLIVQDYFCPPHLLHWVTLNAWSILLESEFFLILWFSIFVRFLCCLLLDHLIPLE